MYIYIFFFNTFEDLFIITRNMKILAILWLFCIFRNICYRELSNISFFFVRLILITSFFDLSKIVTNNLLQRYYSASCDSIHTRLIEQIYKSDRVSSIYVSHSIVIKMKLLTHFPACTFVNKICESDIEFQ